MAKKSKKRKSIKKYAVGGDMRTLAGMEENLFDGSPVTDIGSPNALSTRKELWPPGPGPDWPPRPGGDGSATGQVRQISDSARRAADFLGGAGRAQQQAGKMLGNVDQGGRPPSPIFPVLYKKGGKVKKSAKTKVKVRGAGKAIKGVRPVKMVSMKGS
jgi:hypothetical protein